MSPRFRSGASTVSGVPNMGPLGEDVKEPGFVCGSAVSLCTSSRLSLAYHSATWPPPTQPNPPSPNLVYPAQLP
ncbi:hypothetical protein HaLaN_14059, partial [Haematococcus lacustris]